MFWAGVATTAIGLTMAGIGWPWLRGRRRFAASRQVCRATVVAAEPGRLLVRFRPVGVTQPVEAYIEVPPRSAAEWRRWLEQGPPPSQDPDFDGPEFGWDEVDVSYLRGGSPEAMLAERLELAEHAPLGFVVTGLLLAVVGVLALRPRALLAVVGACSALIAGGVAGPYAMARLRRTAPPAFGVAGIILTLFLGGIAVLCFAAALA